MSRFLLVSLLALALVSTAGSRDRAAVKAEAKAGGAYVHVVLFTMKKDTAASTIDEVIGDCHKMLGKIAAVRSVQAGRRAEKGTPKVAKTNYDVGLLVRVDDFEGLQKYLDDPLHVAFVKKHEKHFDMDRLQVFDFVDSK